MHICVEKVVFEYLLKENLNASLRQFSQVNLVLNQCLGVAHWNAVNALENYQIGSTEIPVNLRDVQ